MFWLILFGGLIVVVGVGCIVLGCHMIQVKERENADRVKLEEVRSFYDTP